MRFLIATLLIFSFASLASSDKPALKIQEVDNITFKNGSYIVLEKPVSLNLRQISDIQLRDGQIINSDQLQQDLLDRFNNLDRNALRDALQLMPTARSTGGSN